MSQYIYLFLAMYTFFAGSMGLLLVQSSTWAELITPDIATTYPEPQDKLQLLLEYQYDLYYFSSLAAQWNYPTDILSHRHHLMDKFINRR